MRAKTFFSSGVQRVPGIDPGRALGELRVRRDDAHLLLLREGQLALLVPAVVELALELVDPVLRGVVRRVGGAGRVVGEERLVRRHGLLHPDPADRLVGQVAVEVVVGDVMGRLDRSRVLEDRRRPLVGVAADEAVEVFEAQARQARGQTARPDWSASRERCGSCRTRTCCSR